MIKSDKSSIASRFLAMLFVIGLLCSLKVTALAAATFSGSGTEKDPYLVTNAEQFNAIRNNLSAHYKLANTIDLASYSNFVPIGNLERPFTGSLTCDLGTDKLPKYAVKNLKVHVKETAYVAENKSKWEAAAFGCARGASFTNVFMLNVKVTNDNFGDNTGAVVYGDYKPGMDEQFSAALVGMAQDCTIIGCMSSGLIDTSSNNCGGLIGRAENSTIANSYSTASVKSKGKWGVGGLIGTLDDTSMTSCFYKGGEVSCGSEYSSQGMLFASAGSSVISDCYASGKGLGGQANLGNFNKSTITNCYTVATITKAIPKEYVGTPTGNTVTNTYILDTSGVVSINLTLPKASAAQLKKSFAGLSAWNTSGTYPSLTAVTILTDEGRYVPGAVNDIAPPKDTSKPGTSSGTQNNSTIMQPGTESTVSQADAADLDELKQLAESLPAASALTEEHIDTVLKAKQMLDSLSDELYAQLDGAVSLKIQESYTAMQPIMLEYLVTKLDKLDVNKVKASDKADILRLNAIYNGLDDSTKEAFSSILLEKLQKAVKKVENFDSDSDTVSTQAMTTAEKLIVILLVIVAVLIFAANAVLIVMVIRKKRVLDHLCTDLNESNKNIYSESEDMGERV